MLSRRISNLEFLDGNEKGGVRLKFDENVKDIDGTMSQPTLPQNLGGGGRKHYGQWSIP